MTPTALVAWLIDQDGAPWLEYRHGRDPISTRGLADLLGRFKISASKPERHAGRKERLYHAGDFSAAFGHYLPVEKQNVPVRSGVPSVPSVPASRDDGTDGTDGTHGTRPQTVEENMWSTVRVTMKDGTTHELPTNSPDLTDDAMRPLIGWIEPLGDTAPAIMPMAGPEPV